MHRLTETEQDPLQEEGVNQPCRYCLAVFRTDNADLCLRSPSGLKYRRKLSTILQTAEECILCGLLLPFWDSTPRKNARWLEKISFGKYCPSIEFRFIGELKDSNRIVALRRRFLWFWVVVEGFEAFAAADNPAAAIVPFPLLSGSIHSEKTFHDIIRWLEVCDGSHAACAQGTDGSVDTLLPSRLINVSPSGLPTGTVRLETTQNCDSNVRYAALSYCWGGEQRCATTTRTYSSYMKGVLISSLPDTLQDAITVTRKLHLQYLWIDSLCIIQDSNTDVFEELRRMHWIYGNAYTTIVACASKNVNEGFLPARSSNLKDTTMPLQVPLGSGGGRITIQRYVHPIADFKIGQGGLRPVNEPINLRGWTFQEQYLSRRILFFRKSTVFWECHELRGGPRAREHHLGPQLSSRVFRKPTAASWTDIVQEYSGRRLSDPHDKLPALSGITADFAARTRHHFAAGLCVDDFPYQLCWKLSTAGSRPAAWRAPSWSWASTDDPVYFLRRTELDFHPEYLSRDLSCSVLNCQVTPVSMVAPFGRVVSGFLEIRGRVLRCGPIPGSHRAGDSLYRIKEFAPAAGERYGGELEFDALSKSFFDPDYTAGPHDVRTSRGTEPWGDPVYCLLLCTQQRTIFNSVEQQQQHREGVWWPFGLALRRDENGDFHRVGLFNGNGLALKTFSEVEAEAIRII